MAKPKSSKDPKQSELPKTMVQPNQLGIYTSHAAQLALFSCQQADVLICKHGASLLSQNTSSEKSSAYTLSEAFFRGKLPEVIVVYETSEEALSGFIEGFFDYMEKLLSLGFFQQSRLNPFQPDPEANISKYIPWIIWDCPLSFTMVLEKIIRKNCRNVFTRFSLPKETVFIECVEKRFIKGAFTFQATDVNFSSFALQSVRLLPQGLQLSDTEQGSLQKVLQQHNFHTHITASSPQNLLQYELERLVALLNSQTGQHGEGIPVLIKGINQLAAEMAIVLQASDTAAVKEACFMPMSFDTTVKTMLEDTQPTFSPQKKPARKSTQKLSSPCLQTAFPLVSIQLKEISSVMASLRGLALSASESV